jgi:hypothetical protein
MIRKLLGLPFEAAQILGMACFFAIALALTFLTSPDWLAKIGKVSPDAAARHFNEVASLVGRNGLWVACAALVGGVIAPYARGDGKKLLAWIRVICTATAVVIVLVTWGNFESLPNTLKDDANKPVAVSKWRSDKKPTPWNALLVATSLNLILGAFQITAGAAKKPKAEGGKDK